MVTPDAPSPNDSDQLRLNKLSRVRPESERLISAMVLPALHKGEPEVYEVLVSNGTIDPGVPDQNYKKLRSELLKLDRLYIDTTSEVHPVKFQYAEVRQPSKLYQQEGQFTAKGTSPGSIIREQSISNQRRADQQQSNNQNTNTTQVSTNQNTRITCRRCQSSSHFRRNCPEWLPVLRDPVRQKQDARLDKESARCYHCNDQGTHTPSICNTWTMAHKSTLSRAELEEALHNQRLQMQNLPRKTQ